MKNQIKMFLDFGIYNNNLYFPNTLIKIREYLKNLDPLIQEIKSMNKGKLYKYIERNDINIYSLSICVSILGLNNKTFSLVTNQISNYKELLIFFWIYKTINPNSKSKYLDEIFLMNMDLLENNYQELFKVYKPPFSIKKQMNKKLKEKYKIMYMIEAQENFDTLLRKIKENKITPDDIKVEMGFAFNEKIKNDIISYFIDNYDLVKMFNCIDSWFMEQIPSDILIKLKDKLNKTRNTLVLYRLLVLNTSLRHLELVDLINSKIKTFEKNGRNTRININYMPNMKLNMKWDKLHSYNSYVSSIIAMLNENFDLFVNLKEKHILSDKTFELYSVILNSNSFSIEKASEINENDEISILFSQEYSKGYDILWDVTNENLPLFSKEDYLLITGKNEILLDSFIKYVLFSSNNN